MKYICFNLPIKFLLNKEKEKKKKISLIILKKQLKEKIIKFKYLCLWIRNNKLKRKQISKQPSGSSLCSHKISFDEFINSKRKGENSINGKNNSKNIIINRNMKNKENLKLRKINSFI